MAWTVAVGLMDNGLVIHEVRRGEWVIRRYDPLEPIDAPWDVWDEGGWVAAVGTHFKGGYAAFTSREAAMDKAETLAPQRAVAP